ncbi:MAG TPA: alkaline phosphatase family protein [Pyrinomonadaceae bacterium]|nr:alkaline phosphatase family protein [Pyrinomonadaceae bacterium]
MIIKVDGLPGAEVDKYVRERDARTGKSALPWIEHIFYQGGTRLENFYVRGMSLSGPSWSLLDTGQHLQIKGNVEFDRFTLHSYDYLNFIPFWIENVGRRRVDMPGPEMLDEIGVPLLVDRYPYDERYVSFQMHQRGLRWTTLERGLKNYFLARPPRELFDEWTLGLGARNMIYDQLERELIGKLADPRVTYLDFYTSEFDHAAHHNRDRATHLAALQELDRLFGRVWTAIEQSSLAAETALVVVSDHGINSDEHFYSQGFNLVKLLGSAEGGGHHVVTKRRLLNGYALKGIYPLVPLITTTTPDSYYLKGQSTDYPTALIDFDGNERSGIHLRDSDLNLLHILLLELQRKDLAPAVRRAATEAFLATLERRRPEWQRTLEELREELGALNHLIEQQRAVVAAQPKKWTKTDQDAGRDKEALRQFARLDSWQADERDYNEYARTLTNLLALNHETFAPAGIRIPDVIAKGAMGDRNSVHELQNYVVGLAPAGLTLAPDGTLSFERLKWRPELPLQIWEDEQLALPPGAERAAWLSDWHTDLEWLHALHRTTYSNGLVGLHEEFARFPTPATEADVPGLTRDEQVLRRFRRRQRALVETDLFIHASDHWNFDVRGFNPGGNHGSFYRVSTHAALMFAGGANTRIPRGLVITEPYDSLSFVPTVLTLTGQIAAPGTGVTAGFAAQPAQFPGRVITELFAAPPAVRPVAAGAPESLR